MQVHPHCGDGVEISVLYTDSVKGTTDVLHAAEYAVQQAPVRCASLLGATVAYPGKWAFAHALAGACCAVLCPSWKILCAGGASSEDVCLTLWHPSPCSAPACMQLVLCCPGRSHAGCEPSAAAAWPPESRLLCPPALPACALPPAALLWWKSCAVLCRQRVLFFLDRLHTGDKIDFIVWPKDDHDCDAALLLEAKIWDSSEFKETTTF